MWRKLIIWAGVIVGISLLVVAGTRVMNRAGSNTIVVVVTSTPDPVVAATAQDKPTPTTDAQIDCREKTTAWVITMNQVLVTMIDTDDAKPLETKQALQTAQTLINTIQVPTCADAQLRAIDTSMRDAVQLYISWTDALIKGNTQGAQAFEDQGDAAFVIDEYFTYLEKNQFSNELQQIRADISRIADQRTHTSTPTAAADRQSAYQACVKDVFAFRTQVDGFYEAAKSHVNVLELYVQRAKITGIDPDLVDRGYASIDKITAPTCIDEPIEILDRLRLMFNTLKPGFVEIKVELAYGNPDAQSYARVQGWIDELHAFERDIDARYKSMPQSLARLEQQDNASNTADTSTGDETHDDRPLNEYALRLDDFPAGMVAEETGFYTAKEIADNWDDPVTALANFKRMGRLDTYTALFSRSNTLPAKQIGIDIINVGVTRTANATNSSELLNFLLTTKTEYKRITIPLKNVDESVALIDNTVCRESESSETVYDCTYLAVYMRTGNIIVQLIAAGSRTDINIDNFTTYAQIVADRLNQ